MANVPLNDPNVDAPAIVPALVNPDHAPAQLIEEDAEEEEEDLEEDPKENLEEDPEGDDEVMEMDDEAEVIDPYMDDGSNNPPPPNFEDEETPPTSSIISNADGCDNIEMDRTVRNVMSYLAGLKKLVKDLSDRFDEYEESKVFEDKRALEKELVNERNGKEFTENTESVEAAIRAERERVQNEANRTGGPNVASVAQECTFADFMKCIPITFRGNEGAVATMEIEAVTRKTKAEIKVMMTEEFCPPEEIQRIEGEVTSSEPATLNKAVRMAHTLMEQKVKAIAEREADNKKRKW
nr:hypothetical protein [Tanacetum cinerariifolium]